MAVEWELEGEVGISAECDLGVRFQPGAKVKEEQLPAEEHVP